MIDKYIQDLVSRQNTGTKVEERDLILIKLMKEIDSLPDDQKKAVLPQLKKTLLRHEQIAKDRQIINRFFFHLDQAIEERKKQPIAEKISLDPVH